MDIESDAGSDAALDAASVGDSNDKDSNDDDSNDDSNKDSDDDSPSPSSSARESNSSQWSQPSRHASDKDRAFDGSVAGGVPSILTDASDSLFDELASIATEASRQK